MSKLTKQQLIQLKKELHTDEAIGKRIGVTRQAIHQMRTKYDIASDRAEIPNRNEEINNHFNMGASVAYLSKQFNLSITQIYRILKEG